MVDAYHTSKQDKINMLLDHDDLLAAQALLYLRYGSVENAITQNAYALEIKKEVDLKLPMEVEEPVAGPSGMCQQGYNCETVATMKMEEVVVNRGIPIGSGRTVVPVDKFCNLRLKDFKCATRSLLSALFPRSKIITIKCADEAKLAKKVKKKEGALFKMHRAIESEQSESSEDEEEEI